MTKALYILGEMSEQDIDWLANSGIKRSISANKILIEEGIHIDALYFVLKGSFIVQSQTPGGLAEVARLGVGDVAGEMSFIDSHPPSATVRAVEDSLVWAIPWSRLYAKLREEGAFSVHFYRAMSVFLSERMRRILPRLNLLDPVDMEDLKLVLESEDDEKFDLAKMRYKYLLNRLAT